jgi:hypothetical protein
MSEPATSFERAPGPAGASESGGPAILEAPGRSTADDYVAELLELGVLAGVSCATILNFYNRRASLAEVRQALVLGRTVRAEREGGD